MANETNLKKKMDIQKHHLPSYSVFPGFIKSISIPRFGFNVWPEFRLCFGNQSSANTKWSFVALRPPILLFLLLTNLFGYIFLFWALQRFIPRTKRICDANFFFHYFVKLDRTSAVVSVHPWANSKWPIGQSERAFYSSYVIIQFFL